MEKSIEIVQVTAESAPMDLLALAEPSEWMIREYLYMGDCYVAKSNGKVVGTYVLAPYNKSDFEIKNIAILPEYQHQGIGHLLVAHALEICKKQGAKELVTKTANSSKKALSFYKKLGFKQDSIVRGYFLKYYEEPIIENGEEAIDRIILKKLV